MTGEVETLSKLMRLLTEFSRGTQQIKLPLPAILSTAIWRAQSKSSSMTPHPILETLSH